MHERIHEQKPWVRFGISPFGIWRNSSSDPDGSDTSGSESYDMISADSLTWVREGWVDYINPQVYWEFGNEAADYETLAKWWAGAVEGTGVALYIGEAAYKATDGTFPDPAELGDHLDLTTQLEQVDGNVYFSAVSLRDDTTGFVEDLVERHYEHPALVPVIDSIPGQAPEEPTLISVQRTGTGVLLRWTGRGTDATSYAIWRLESEQAREKDLADRRNLVATMRDDGPGLQEFVHDGADGAGRTVVTAYDRTWRQTDPSDAQEARGCPSAARRSGGRMSDRRPAGHRPADRPTASSDVARLQHAEQVRAQRGGIDTRHRRGHVELPERSGQLLLGGRKSVADGNEGNAGER